MERLEPTTPLTKSKHQAKDDMPEIEELALPLKEGFLENVPFTGPRGRTDAPFRHTDRSTFEMVHDNLRGVIRPETPVIDKDRSGGASREELQAYLRDVRRSSTVDKDFVESYRKQFLDGFSERDLNKDGELQPQELLVRRPERSYEDEENDRARSIANPTEAEKSNIAALRAETPREFLGIIDRVNTRKDHRVEKVLLEFLRHESPEAQMILKGLDNARVRVVMPLFEGGPYASVNTLNRQENGTVTSADGLRLELSATLGRPYAPTFRNEFLHVQVISKVAKEVSNGRGFPLTAKEYELYLGKAFSLDHEITSSVAQVTEPGEKITFREFYQRLVRGEDSSKKIEKPESYFALAYRVKVLLQRPEAIPIRQLLLTNIDSTMSERELQAFEKFSKAIATVVMESQEEGDVKDLDALEERLAKLNPSRNPDFYYR